MKRIFSTILVTLGLILWFALPASAVTQYVADPASCTATDPVTFPGQSCAPLNICGNSSGTAECFATASISAPAASSTTSAAPLASSLAGGYIIDCNATSDSAAPFCNNNGAGFCNATTANYTTNRRTTICIGGLYASSTPGDCRSGFQDCALPATSCEVQTSVTANVNPNTTYGASCSFACSSGFLDCDGDGTGSGAGGCEITVGGACTAGGLPGTFGPVCSGAAGNCVVPTQHYISGVETRYSSASSAPHLWGVQYGSDPLAWLWSFNASTTGGHFFIDNIGRVGIGTTSTSQAQLTVKATSSLATAFTVLDHLGKSILRAASSSVKAFADFTGRTSTVYGPVMALEVGNTSTPGTVISRGDGGYFIYDVYDEVTSQWTASEIILGSHGNRTTTYAADELYFNQTTMNPNGVFWIRSTGNVSTSGTLKVYGATDLAGLTFTSATGTNALITNVTSTNISTGGLSFTNANGTSITSTNAFFSLLAVAQANFTNLLTTNVTSTNLYVSGLTNLNGAFTFTSASGTAITSTRAIFDSATTTNIAVTGLTVLANTTLTNATTTNLYVSALSNFNGALTFTSASGTAITSTLAVFDSVTTTNIYFTTGAGTSLTVTDATSTNLYTSGALTFNNHFGYAYANNSSPVSFSNLIPNTDISGLGTMSTQNSNNITVTGGSINGTTIGASTPSTGSFTTLLTSGILTMPGALNSSITTTNFSSVNVAITGGNGTFTSITSTNLNISGQTMLGNLNTLITSVGNISSSGTLRVFATSTFNTTTFASGVAINPTISFINNTGVGLFNPGANQLGFATASSSRMFIDSNGFIMIGTSTPSSSLHIARGTLTINVPSSTSFGASTNTEAIYSVDVVGGVAAVMTATHVKMYDVTSPSNPRILGAASSTETSYASSYKLDYDGKHVYAPGFSWNYSIYNASDPSRPRTTVVSPSNSSVGLQMQVSGNRLFVAINSDGLKIFSNFNPDLQPQLIATVATSTIKAFALQGDFAYTAERAILRVIDVTSTVPAVRGQVNLPNNVDNKKDIACSGSFCYIAASSDGLVIVDVSKPSAPVIASNTTAFGSLTSIVVVGRYAYVAQGSNMQIIDVSSSTFPFQVGIHAAGGTINGIEVNGRYAFLATSAGLKVVDLTGLDVANANVDNLTAWRLTVRDRFILSGSMTAQNATFNGSVNVYGPFSAFASSTFGGNIFVNTSTANVIKRTGGATCVLFTLNPVGPNPITTSTITCPVY